VTAPLFLLEGVAPDAWRVSLSGREGHHAADVRRLRVGERVEVTDGRGTRLGCEVRAVARGQVDLEVTARRVEPEPSPRLEVAQALIKSDAAERALAGMTEVGVDAVWPWAAQRSVVTWDADRVERGVRRWRTIVAEAAKQSRRSRVPDVGVPLSTAQLAQRVREVDVALLLDVAGSEPLAAVEVATEATVLLIVGPEGGETPDESAALVAAGARPVHLGPTVLRSATAGTAAAAVLLSGTRRWLTRHEPVWAG
jgi:16S rRNA (uracil1498-N3)-methyltransferase